MLWRGSNALSLARVNEFQKRFASRFVIFALEPFAQVLHPVNDFTELRKAMAPVGPRNQLIDIELIGQTSASVCEVF